MCDKYSYRDPFYNYAYNSCRTKGWQHYDMEEALDAEIEAYFAKAIKEEMCRKFKEFTKFPRVGFKTERLLKATNRSIVTTRDNFIGNGKTTEMFKDINNVVTNYEPKDVMKCCAEENSKGTIVVGVESQFQVGSLIGSFRGWFDRDWKVTQNSTLTKGNWEVIFVPLTSYNKVLEATVGKNVVALFIEHTVLENQIRRAMNSLLEYNEDSKEFENVKNRIDEIRIRIATRVG